MDIYSDTAISFGYETINYFVYNYVIPNILNELFILLILMLFCHFTTYAKNGTF